MITPQVLNSLPSTSPNNKFNIILVGIESQICITQTTLDLLELGYGVYLISDGISSVNKQEIPIALKRLSNEGAIITSSESIMFEVLNDATHNGFKEMQKLLKETKNETNEALKALTSRL